ncbi:MAG: radical SAM protein [Candidatus Woesearchaeota archaeon]
MESPSISKKWRSGIKEMQIAYPNLYYGGVYCLAPLIIYNLVNKMDGWRCERSFLDKGRLSSDLIGFTLQYEPDYYNVIAMLKKAQIPLKKHNRRQVLFAGGPCVNANPYTLSEYFDFFVMGEVEGIMEDVLSCYQGNKAKFLEEIASIKGIFVPGLNEPSYHWLPSLDKVPYPLFQPLPETIDKSFVFGKAFLLEVERGCAFSCKFCPMPMFHNTVKKRSLESLKEIIDLGLKINKRDKVVIYSPSFSHPQRKGILSYLLEKNVKFTVPSLKAELLDEEFLRLIKKGGQNSITIAPECGEAMRKKIGKFGSDKVFFNAVQAVKNAGIKELKLYFMAGLPGETPQDLDETIALVEGLKKSFMGKLYVSINPFVPKPGTEFAAKAFDKKKASLSVSYLRKRFSQLKIRAKAGSVASSYREWKLAHAKSFP